MIYINNECQNPWYNLALEEYFLKDAGINEDIVVLWQNRKAVIIGRHQNTAAQLNQKYAAEHDIDIARRMTGGGAVYHDLGNLNYTFITSYEKCETIDFREFAGPVIEALGNLGLKAELSGRNDITVNGRKISGTAQAGAGKKIMFHGTLMYDVDTETLSRVLSVDVDKIRAKGVASVKSRVGNMKDYLPANVGIDDIKREILNVMSSREGVREYFLSSENRKAITELTKHKYGTEEWIFGESREGEFRSKKRFPGGEMEFVFSLNNGCIADCGINGDFLGLYGVDDVEEVLNGTLYEYEAVKNVLFEMEIADYFGSITYEQILECMFAV